MPRRSIHAEVVDERGRGAVVKVTPNTLATKAGYAPERLDGIIDTLIANANTGAEMLQRYSPMLDGVMQELYTQLQRVIAGTESRDANQPQEDPNFSLILSLVDKLSMAMDRLQKMTLNAVKAKDDASRLRSFLAGDQEAEDLSGKSDSELRRLVNDAAAGFQKV